MILFTKCHSNNKLEKLFFLTYSFSFLNTFLEPNIVLDSQSKAYPCYLYAVVHLKIVLTTVECVTLDIRSNIN